ncbi:MAG: hypothetical protein U0325_27470 [Polyangiales bacterium]
MSVHTGSPDEHTICAVWHALLPGHAAPAWQTMHAPVRLHTWSTPQDVPGVTVEVTVQTGSPVSHTMAPRVQRLPVSQVAPRAQGTHAPVRLHTLPVAQSKPGGRVPTRTQVAVPPVHESAPMAQGSLSAQSAPGMHATQSPVPLHTAVTPGVHRYEVPAVAEPAAL